MRMPPRASDATVRTDETDCLHLRAQAKNEMPNWHVQKKRALGDKWDRGVLLLAGNHLSFTPADGADGEATCSISMPFSHLSVRHMPAPDPAHTSGSVGCA